MDDDGQNSKATDGAPARKPTGWEKFTVLLPALVALLGLVVMILIFAVLVSMSRS